MAEPTVFQLNACVPGSKVAGTVGLGPDTNEKPHQEIGRELSNAYAENVYMTEPGSLALTLLMTVLETVGELQYEQPIPTICVGVAAEVPFASLKTVTTAEVMLAADP